MKFVFTEDCALHKTTASVCATAELVTSDAVAFLRWRKLLITNHHSLSPGSADEESFNLTCIGISEAIWLGALRLPSENGSHSVLGLPVSDQQKRERASAG